MKIYKIPKENLITFNYPECSEHKFISINHSNLTNKRYCTLSEVKGYLDIFKYSDEFLRIWYSTRDYSIFTASGIMFVKARYSEIADPAYVTLIYNKDGENHAYISSCDAIEDIPASIVSIGNKFMKNHGVKLKNVSFLDHADLLNTFCLPFRLGIDDYNENVQKRISSEFLKEELAKLNTEKDE